MDNNFPIAVRELILDEGEYVNDKDDQGGETKFGISKASFPHLNIATLTREDAKAIYYKEYWLASGCDILPSGVDYFIFDTAVLHGNGFAVKLVQRAVKCSVIDGVIGPKTRERIKRYANADHTVFLKKVATYRIDKYRRIVAYNPTQEKYFNGWVGRTIENYAFTLMQFGDFEHAPVSNHDDCLDRGKVQAYLKDKAGLFIDQLLAETKK